MSLVIVPSQFALGAEVSGLNLARRLSRSDIYFVKKSVRKHLVLLFRNQLLTTEQFQDFAQCLGKLIPPGPNPYGRTIYPEFPLLNRISNLADEKGQRLGNLGSGELTWHTDMTYTEEPPRYIALYALEIPATGAGDTSFASMTRAYKTLPSSVRKMISNRQIVHDSAHNSAGELRRGYVEPSDPRHSPGPRRPIIYRESRNQPAALLLGRRPHAYVVGLDPAESDALLEVLWAHATEPSNTWTHSWKPGDLLLWRNLMTIHRREAFPATERRNLLRAQIA